MLEGIAVGQHTQTHHTLMLWIKSLMPWMKRDYPLRHHTLCMQLFHASCFLQAVPEARKPDFLIVEKPRL